MCADMCEADIWVNDSAGLTSRTVSFFVDHLTISSAWSSLVLLNTLHYAGLLCPLIFTVSNKEFPFHSTLCF